MIYHFFGIFLLTLLFLAMFLYSCTLISRRQTLQLFAIAFAISGTAWLAAYLLTRTV